MNILIVEDEQLAAERLQILLKQFDPSIKIMANLESVEETVNWLNTKTHPDLFLMDIHLSDGRCFDIFKKASTQKPIVFTTAFENYAIDAFRLFSLDYILKPVTLEALAGAMNKYKNLSASFAPTNYNLLSEEVADAFSAKYRDRFLAKIGQRLFFIKASDVAYFYADNKIVYLVDREGNRFIVNYTLEKLETILDPHEFFRINRKIIVHAGVIDQVKTVANNRFKLLLKGIKTTEEITISRDKMSDFRIWADS